MNVSTPMLRTALLALLATSACATYRALPVPPPRPGLEPVAAQLEKTRLLFFKSAEEVAVERAYLSPTDRALILATVTKPEGGVWSSRDGGREWSFTKVSDDEPSGDQRALRGSFAPRVFRDLLFDPRDGKVLYGRSATRLWLSEDAGQSFEPLGTPWEGANGRVQTAALGADGTLYAASNGRLAASRDHGRTYRAVALPTDPGGQPEGPRLRIRSIAPVPGQPGSLYVSIGADRGDLLPALMGLVDRTSPDVQTVLDLVSPRPESPRAYGYGDGREGVYLSEDGGARWTKTALALEAWLCAEPGAITAVAADQLLEVASLARRYPELAAVATTQLHSGGVDLAALQAALRYPGQARVLAGTVGGGLIFRSVDNGKSWSRLDELLPAQAAAARESIDRQRSAWLEPPAPKRPKYQQARAPAAVAPPSVNFRGPNQPLVALPGTDFESRASKTPRAALVMLFDPLQLLTRFNAGLPLSGLARTSGGALVGFAPTEEFWNALALALAKASAAEGELSLGPGATTDPLPSGAFQLLRSADGGAHFAGEPMPTRTFDPDGSLAARGLIPYPTSIAPGEAQTLLPISAIDRGGRAWQHLWRLVP